MAAERTLCLTGLHTREEMGRIAKYDATVACNRIIIHQDHFRYTRSPGPPSQLGRGRDILESRLVLARAVAKIKNQDDRVRELRKFAAVK